MNTIDILHWIIDWWWIILSIFCLLMGIIFAVFFDFAEEFITREPRTNEDPIWWDENRRLVLDMDTVGIYLFGSAILWIWGPFAGALLVLQIVVEQFYSLWKRARSEYVNPSSIEQKKSSAAQLPSLVEIKTQKSQSIRNYLIDIIVQTKEIELNYKDSEGNNTVETLSLYEKTKFLRYLPMAQIEHLANDSKAILKLENHQGIKAGYVRIKPISNYRGMAPPKAPPLPQIRPRPEAYRRNSK